MEKWLNVSKYELCIMLFNNEGEAGKNIPIAVHIRSTFLNVKANEQSFPSIELKKEIKFFENVYKFMEFLDIFDDDYIYRTQFLEKDFIYEVIHKIEFIEFGYKVDNSGDYIEGTGTKNYLFKKNFLR